MQAQPVSGALLRSQQETPEPELEPVEAGAPETQLKCTEQRPDRLSGPELPEQKRSAPRAGEHEGETARRNVKRPH